ncbi:MAG: BLUF domain-containing protein [Methylobacter sp.]|uniref:BLUF domain-containing protein n=1 Tax=Methylobacter sp. TaxID=2051955 RepID=UPI002731FA10|nr:BLUF domain-containing protein [Methylobacter sp.]MDP1664175.1 BLUF domain-containing protein [Methylobacter sp.]MDP1969305.1 BLUF domain-containing protein [Methylobacter sp.]
MIRLLYFSQSTDVISDEQVRNIMESSRRNNPAIGITGVLVHGGGLFMQVLEGPEQAALRMYVKILDDQRHKNSQIIYITPTDKRIFVGWSMGVIARNDAVEFEQIMELRSQRRKEVVQSKVFTDAMRGFLKILNDGQRC